MRRKWWIVAVLGLAFALALPYVSAEPIRIHLESSLESALSRRVRIQGKTHFRLIPSPALIAQKVIIDEDPNYSLEPFAYVTELEVQPRLSALLSGKLTAARLRLKEPSVNLMRGATGWNVQSLGKPGLRPPEIEVRNGRLNFKQGDAKSAFYLTNALVDISAPSAQGDVTIFMSAEPARTDRGAQGFGNVAVRGEIHAPGPREPELDLDIELQPSALHAFNFFFGARGVDFAGKLAAKGRIKGPWTRASINGTLQLEGLEPQSFLPFAGKSDRIALAGSIDFPGQHLALDTVGGTSLRTRIRARDFFQKPKGAFLLDVRRIDAAKLLEFGHAANAKLPAGISAKGQFSAVVGYSWPSPEEVPAKGMIWFEDARLDLPDQPSLEIRDARAIVEGSRWRLAPAEIVVGQSQSAAMDADWNARTGALRVNVATQLLSVKGLTKGLGMLLRASNLPFLPSARGGSWQGNVKYERTEDSDEGVWSGRLSVRNISLDVEGISAPLEISSASVLFDPSHVTLQRMRAEWDGTEFEGNYQYFPGSKKPGELDLVIQEASTSGLESLLHDAYRPPPGLLEKIRFRRAKLPDWLLARNLSGRLRFKTLNFAGGAFQPLVLQIDWRGVKLKSTITHAAFVLFDAPGSLQWKGSLEAELWQPAPRYRFDGQISNWPTGEGSASFDGTLQTTSLREGWLESLDGEGTVLLTGSTHETAKLVARQGQLTLDFGEGKRKSAHLTPPYWPLDLPDEP
ncbi:AsmA family protein [Bryobacter aggregatus]|uniref:AsmA family protein n=1 Tax=Bryobacter aggregatus TaxID=360054 RepID=UPI00055BAFE1|nr:hypothetical protein [Bryobacter aggregatus]